MVRIELFDDFFSEEAHIPSPIDPEFWTCRTIDFFEKLLGMGLYIESRLIEGYIINNWTDIAGADWTGFSYGDSESILDCDRWFVFCVPAPNSSEPIHVMVWQTISWEEKEVYFSDQIPVRVRLEDNTWVPAK